MGVTKLLLFNPFHCTCGRAQKAKKKPRLPHRKARLRARKAKVYFAAKATLLTISALLILMKPANCSSVICGLFMKAS